MFFGFYHYVPSEQERKIRNTCVPGHRADLFLECLGWEPCFAQGAFVGVGTSDLWDKTNGHQWTQPLLEALWESVIRGNRSDASLFNAYVLTLEMQE